MKKVVLACMLLLMVFSVSVAQITYIGVTNHNTGSGTNNLFNYYVSPSQNCYVDWDVYYPGLSSGDPCGTKTVSRVVLRRTADNDPTSVVASEPIYITGICNGKNGNNDKYYVNLSSYINLPGRYSVEIQADVLPLAGTAFDNSNTRTTWNYMCPPAYYLTGASGTTGFYYTPPLSCSYGGKSDPVGGGTTIDAIQEINAGLFYFTVGESGNYREMVVFNGVYYDMQNGKFQPGNPRVPSTLNGRSPIPYFGICAAGPAPVLPMGAEVNSFKRTNCSADVTGATMFYRVYKSGSTAPSYSSFAIPFRDNCPGPSGPANNTFPAGGSCNNINNVMDQRWQVASGVSNILPTVFTNADAGIWVIEFYTETYIKNCSGAASVVTSTVNSTTFTVVDPAFSGGLCAPTPLKLESFTAVRKDRRVVLNWQVTDVVDVDRFIPELSEDGINFSPLGSVSFENGKRSFEFSHVNYELLNRDFGYYRLKIVDADGKVTYSPIVKVNYQSAGDVSMIVKPGVSAVHVQLKNLPQGNYKLMLFNMDGRLEHATAIQQISGSEQICFIPVKGISQKVYTILLRNERGAIVVSKRFVIQ